MLSMVFVIPMNPQLTLLTYLYIYTKPMCLKTPAEQLESSGQYLTLGQTVDPHGQPVMVRTCHVIDSRVLLKE